MAPSPAYDTAVLIPSYQPDERLPSYIETLRGSGLCRIVVVDDGSGPAYGPTFDAISQDAVVRVLHEEPNRGKGAALKRGMEYLRDECPECSFIITADSDGQHTAEDVLRMSDALHAGSQGLHLGTRSFRHHDVPWKSRAGNNITAIVFWLLYGLWVSDTQTGLRGFSKELLPVMIAVKGERYEYEMNMLIACATAKIPLQPLPIETVYENNNEGSHFRSVRDSARIYRVIFSGFFRFIGSSALSFLVDYGLYLLINNLLKAAFPSLYKQLFLGIAGLVPNVVIATVTARLGSGIFNFFLNKRFVFDNPATTRKTFPRYLCVFVTVMLLSAVLTSILHQWTGWSDNIAKIPVDLLLFFFSYRVQQKWVFSKQR
ncbi:MAG: bifunctional glycosyltransferase family 2/GtrA family protein [Clostridia bacterium]|nr:bifunctional glycosyltransferase family 2/GtrA family protein [Clostridia bacterium]